MENGQRAKKDFGRRPCQALDRALLPLRWSALTVVDVV